MEKTATGLNQINIINSGRTAVGLTLHLIVLHYSKLPSMSREQDEDFAEVLE